ncbi:VanZ family protein [Streptosporangium sp. NBC_01495]|uniref:VanZ family protein n=1 Tax=Streptosporangium sp. NBC_01495 TaxID=2903899 RepID=UPI002E352C23|nr:VanZ family protein [Streptosporangium sp. NBC_01495]
MHQAWQQWGNVILAALAAIPAVVLAVHLLALRRTRAGHPFPVRTALADVVAVAGTVPWIWMILTPGAGLSDVSLIPFADLWATLHGPGQAAFVQVGGNLLVFAALGAMLPVRSARFASLTRIAAVAAGASLTVEVLQYALRLGRISSVDDVIVNAAGAVSAALVTRRWWAARIPVGTVPR